MSHRETDDHLRLTQTFSLLQYVHTDNRKRIRKIVELGVENLINLTEPKDGVGVLHMAVSANNHMLLRYLLSLGADPNVQDVKGRTAIMLAARLANERLVTLLIEGQADLLLQDVGGRGVLFYCVYPTAPHARCLELVVKGGADVNNVSAQGVHVFQRMCENAEKCAPSCVLMLEAGADPEAVNKATGTTALMAAARANAVELVRALLKGGADPNALSTEGLSALHHAANVGSLAVVQVLSAYAVDMQALTAKNWTALHYAASSGNALLCTFLAQRGCDLKQKNQENKLARDTAKICKQKAAMKELKKAEKLSEVYTCTPQMLTFYDWSQENQEEVRRACGEHREALPKEDFISVIQGLGAPVDEELLSEVVSAVDLLNTDIINIDEFIKADAYVETPFLHSSFLPKVKKAKGKKKGKKTPPPPPEPPKPDGGLLLKMMGKVTNHTDTQRFDSPRPPAHHLADDSPWYIKKPPRTLTFPPE